MEILIVIALLIGLYIYFKNNSGARNEVNDCTIPKKRSSSSHASNTNRSNSQTYKKSLIETNREILEIAIEKNKNIKFRYKDKDEKLTNRTVNPKRLFMYQLDEGDGQMLCIESFCYLRNASRTFALFRMSNVQIM
jgi:predicted DNA-binding transcriptional regulator YafY